jgi:5-methylcytosine-specific restriction endonuclease McrA
MLRQPVLDRARGECERCGMAVGRKRLAVHHVHELISGAPEIVPITELEALCDRCHVRARYGRVG